VDWKYSKKNMACKEFAFLFYYFYCAISF
jgi:hypothetical protein